MKTLWYEVLKAYTSKLLLAAVLLTLVANAVIFYNSLMTEYQYIIKNTTAYNRIIADYREKPVDQAYDELKAMNNEIQAYTSIQALTQNMLGYSQEEIDSELKRIEDRSPGILEKYNNNSYRPYSSSLEADVGLVADVYDMIEYIHGYKEYISTMTDKMNDMMSVSVFYKQGTFAYRNIVKTPQDFAPLVDIPLKLDTSKGVVQATAFNLSDIYVLGIALLLCIYLISIEKERKLLMLVKSTRNGRGREIISKLCVLSLSIGVIALLLYGSNILIAKQVLGLGDMDRYIQSIPDFRGCSVIMTVGQYLAIFLTTKILVAVLFSLFILGVFLLTSSSSFAYAVIAATSVLEWAAWRFIGTTSYVNHFKFINVFAFLDAFDLFSTYQNLNIFGLPVNIRMLFCVVVPACIIALMALCYIAFTRFKSHDKASLTSFAVDMARLQLSRIPGHVSLFFHELYKLLLSQKALLILALLLILQYNTVTNFLVVRNSDQIIYQHYLKQVEGRLTDRTREYIIKEQSNFVNIASCKAQADDDFKNHRITQAEYNGIMNRQSLVLERSTAFGWITAQYDYLDQISKGKGIDTWFVDPMGYTKLFALDGYGDDVMNGLLVTAALIACLAAAFAYENAIRSKRIIIASREGRGRVVLHKCLSCYLCAAVLFVLVYGVQFYNVYTEYHLADWNAPIQSIMRFNGDMLVNSPQIDNFPFHFTIGEYALIIYSIRLVGIMAIVSIILFLSSISNSVFISIFASNAILEVPALLYLLGFENAKYFSYTEILSGNMLLANNNIIIWLIVIFALCGGITSTALYFTKRLFCRIRLSQ